MDEDRKKGPGERFNDIINAEDEEDKSTLPKPDSQPQPETLSKSPLDKLPRFISSTPKATTPSSSIKQGSHTQETEGKEIPRREKILRALWTVASVISIAVNVILIAFFLVVLPLLRGFMLPEDINIKTLNDLLSGLYTNFEKMDQATIQTFIPVDAQIPLDISIPVQTTTQITLAESVVVPNAQVVINTGGLNINSSARVTLPAGTPLNVNLDFALPVQTTIPVHLEVPVNIPMANTELHEPFVGLQNVVRPLYCLVDPAAVSSITGEPICNK